MFGCYVAVSLDMADFVYRLMRTCSMTWLAIAGHLYSGLVIKRIVFLA